MASKMVSCAGCQSPISSGNYLTCCVCKLSYDLQCVNVPKARFTSALMNEKKSTWKCPGCISKVPKTGNVNTPVGASQSSRVRPVPPSPLSSGSETDNVNVRRGSGCPNITTNLEHSYLDDTNYLDNMRSVIRDEFERIIDERLVGLISKVVEEKTAQATLPLHNKIAELTTRIVLLESESARKSEERPVYKNAHEPSTEPPIPRLQVVVDGGPSHSDCVSFLAGPHSSSVSGEPSQQLPRNSVIQASQWTEVSRRRSRGAPAGIMRGAAAPGATKLVAAERRRQLHLYYLKVGTTEADVLDHLRTVSGDCYYTAETLKARGNYASFKIDVPAKLADTIMSPENWPQDVCIKPWRQSFRKPQEGQRS